MDDSSDGRDESFLRRPRVEPGASETERTVADDRRVDERLVGRFVDAEVVDEDLVVVLAQRRRAACAASGRPTRSGTAASACADARPPDGRSPRRSPRACSCGWSIHRARVAPDAGGHAVRDEQLGGLADVASAHHSPRSVVELVVTRRAGPRSVASCGSRRPRGAIRARRTSARPLLVGGDRDREPLLVAAARGTGPAARRCGLRLPSRSSRLPYAVVSSTSSAAALSAPSTIVTSSRLPRPVASRSASPTSSANAACMPAFGSLGPALDARLVVGVAGDPRQPGDLLHRLREAHVVAPRARQPERRHPHEDAARVDRADLLPLEPEVAEHARREVLEDRVALARSATAAAPARPRCRGRG